MSVAPTTMTLYAVVNDDGSLFENDYGLLVFTSVERLLAWTQRPAQRFVVIESRFTPPGATPEHALSSKRFAAAVLARRETMKAKAHAKYLKQRERRRAENVEGA